MTRRRDPLRVEMQGAIVTLTLDRPAKLNAIDPEMLRSLEDALGTIDAAPEVRVVILTGAGDRAFSAGADIDAWSALAPIDMWRQWIRTGHRVIDRLAGLRQPVIAAINGYALGGGLELALGADVRLAAEGARLGTPEVVVGTVPGWGATGRLTELIGPARAKQLIFTGRPVSASVAQAWGLVNDVFPDPELMAAARELAEHMSAQAPVAIQIAKQLIDARPRPSTASLEALGGALVAATRDGAAGAPIADPRGADPARSAR